MEWWREEGFDFPSDGDGTAPLPSAVLAYCMEHGGWSAKRLAGVLNIDRTQISRMLVEATGQKGGWDSMQRRQALTFAMAASVGLSTAKLGRLFGLFLPEAPKREKLPALPPTTINVSKVSNDFNELQFTSTLDPIDQLRVTLGKIQRLYPALAHAHASERLAIRRLLVHHVIFAAKVYRDQLRFNQARQMIQRARDLCKHEAGVDDLMAQTFAAEGVIYLEQDQYDLALPYYEQALKYPLPIGLRTECRSVLAECSVWVGTDTGDRSLVASGFRVMAQLREQVVAYGAVIDPEHRIRYDLDRNKMDTGTLYTKAGQPGRALEIFSSVELGPQSVRRKAYTARRSAEALFNQGEYVEAALVAQDAMKLIRQTQSKMQIHRLEGLYESLASGPAKNNPEVIELGWMLKA